MDFHFFDAFGKGQLVSKGIFGVFISSKKRKKKRKKIHLITDLIAQVELFSFVFWND